MCNATTKYYLASIAIIAGIVGGMLWLVFGPLGGFGHLGGGGN
jgi:hypothetical protein